MTSTHSDPHTQPHPHRRFNLRNLRNIRLRGGVVPLRAAFRKLCQSFRLHRRNRAGSPPPSAASPPSQPQTQPQTEPQPQPIPCPSTLTGLSQPSSLGSPQAQQSTKQQQQQQQQKQEEQHPSLFSVTASTCESITSSSSVSTSYPTSPDPDSLGGSSDLSQQLPSDDPLVPYCASSPPPRRAPFNGGNTCYLDCVLVALFAEYDGWEGLLQTASSSVSSAFSKKSSGSSDLSSDHHRSPSY